MVHDNKLIPLDGGNPIPIIAACLVLSYHKDVDEYNEDALWAARQRRRNA